MRLNSKKGFYMVSPFLGFFFFLMAMGIAAFYISENNQRIATARAEISSGIIFTTFAIQADVQDVFFQNFLQDILDKYEVGRSGDPDEPPPIITLLEAEVDNAMAHTLEDVYRELYSREFGVSCDTGHKAWSAIVVTFNGQRQVVLLKDDDGNDYSGAFSPRGKTAIWPLASRYSLNCTTDEPPVKIQMDFASRWYFLDAYCICCQAPAACEQGPPNLRVRFEDCIACVQPEPET